MEQRTYPGVIQVKTTKTNLWMHAVLCGLGLASALGSTGCQITEGGQTLPSPYYQEDDVQYFPAGPEFILTREAEVQEAFRVDEQLRQRGRN